MKNEIDFVSKLLSCCMFLQTTIVYFSFQSHEWQVSIRIVYRMIEFVHTSAGFPVFKVWKPIHPTG